VLLGWCNVVMSGLLSPERISRSFTGPVGYHRAYGRLGWWGGAVPHGP
jgi:hypothetical protein